eukprot:3839563-Prymnesium_polylepis.1
MPPFTSPVPRTRHVWTGFAVAVSSSAPTATTVYSRSPHVEVDPSGISLLRLRKIASRGVAVGVSQVVERSQRTVGVLAKA